MSSKLSPSDRKFLLGVAREVIRSELSGEPFTMPSVPASPALNEHRGAFVTLHEHGQLRGCIGNFMSTKPLYETVADMAISAAFHDPRFMPLRPEEFGEIDIEISALTPLEPIDDVEKIQVGVHGIYLINGPNRGVLLPQVATEYGWDRYTFLDQTCLKAGMGPGCWRDPGTQILIFSAEVFGEKSEGLM